MYKFNQTYRAVTLCLLPFSCSVFAEYNPLSQELQRLKHQEALQDAEKALQQADKFLSQQKQTSSEAEIVVDKNLPVIQKITVDTRGVDTLVDLSPIIARYQGANITSKQIFAISREITAALYQAGYVTSAVGLKSASLSDGHLQFIVYWGEVDRYLVNGELPTGFKDKAMLAVLPKFQQNIFNLHQIDQFIEMMNTSNKSVNIDVMPSQTEGKSDLNFITQRTKLPKFQLGYNNSGVENNANGRNQATLAVRMGDVIGTNDEWNISMGYRFYRQPKQNKQINYSLNYSQPFSFYTFDTKLAQSNYERLVKGNNDSYSSSGRTNTLGLKLSRMLFRNKESIFSVYTELEFKTRNNFLVGRKVLERHEYKMNLGLSYITNLLNGKFYSELTYSNGLNWFNADALAYDSQRDRTLKTLSGNITWSKPIQLLNHNSYYQLRIGAQYSPYYLYSDNQFSLGDEYTVRGFKGGVISGESGAYIAQTLSFPFYPQKFLISQITPFVGFDVGQIYPKSEQPRQTISGFTTGVKATFFNQLSLAFSYAKPLKNIEHNPNKAVYYFNGTISF